MKSAAGIRGTTQHVRVVALEEHTVTPELLAAWADLDPQWADPAGPQLRNEAVEHRLLERGAERIAAMDAAGVEVQVLSVTTPGVQSVDAGLAVALARAANDGIARSVAAAPKRFQGFATLPTADGEAASRELERAVKTLGLNGAMVFGRTRDRSFDAREFWPIFEAADEMRAPLYMHPQVPLPAVRSAYYEGFGDELDLLFARPGIGWHYETGIAIVRLALAGVFDRFPHLQIITGHWGEVVLFYLERMDMMKRRVPTMKRSITEYFQQHVMVTPSGLYSQRYMRWATEVLGVERILMSTDYPYVPTSPGGVQAFLAETQMGTADRKAVGHGNWERIVAAIRRQATL